MKRIELPFLELIGIAVTRGLLGAGLALLLGDRLGRPQRRLLGEILTTIGALSTIPFAWDVLHRRTVRVDSPASPEARGATPAHA